MTVAFSRNSVEIHVGIACLNNDQPNLESGTIVQDRFLLHLIKRPKLIAFNLVRNV